MEKVPECPGVLSICLQISVERLQCSWCTAKVQEWMGHANVSTTRLYNRRKTRPEDSPTFHAKY
jgi:hypothetical protein